MKANQPLLEYLATCSEASLQSFELARLNDAANLRQELMQQIVATVDELVEADTQARLARWMNNLRRRTPHNTQRFSDGGAQRLASQTRRPLFPSAEHSSERARLRNARRLLALPEPSRTSNCSKSSARLTLVSVG